MADPPMPSALQYVPLVYRHRVTQTPGFTIFTSIVALLLAGWDWRGGGPAWWWQVVILGVPAGLTVLSFVLHWGSECRVEGDSLWFASQGVPATSVAISDIISIDRVDGGEETLYEIVVRGKGRMRVNAAVFEPIEPLRQVLLAANPVIHFGAVSPVHCRGCGQPFFDHFPSVREMARHLRHGKCETCGTPFPKHGKFV